MKIALLYNDLRDLRFIRHGIVIIQIFYERQNSVIRMNHKRTKRVCEKSEKKNIEHKEAMDHPAESIFQGIVS